MVAPWWRRVWDRWVWPSDPTDRDTVDQFTRTRRVIGEAAQRCNTKETT